MQNKPMSPCAKHGCPSLTKSKYCEAHTPSAKDYDRHRQTAHERGYTAKWKRYRKAYLAKPGNQLCALRLTPKCAIKAECIDHIKPHRGDQALFWAATNHQPACIHCNSVKGNRTNPTASCKQPPPPSKTSPTPPSDHGPPRS